MRIRQLLGGWIVACVVIGCKNLTGDQSLPAGTNDPSYYKTPAGAVMMRNAAESLFVRAFQTQIIESGLLSDELEDSKTGAVALGGAMVSDPLDERILPEQLTMPTGDLGGRNSYVLLQIARGAINQAIGALAAYAPSAPSALRGEMYALQGYTELMLADQFCSGVPLSTLDFDGDFTYHAGSATSAVYNDAIAKFDTALTLSGDSARIAHLARVGLGRAYLALGRFSDAAQAVAPVPNDFQYSVTIGWQTPGFTNALNQVATLSNGEGTNGLLFRTSNDPRTLAIASVRNDYTRAQLYFPQKYATALTTNYAPAVIADGVEARLIEAEAALHAGDTQTWLTKLNALRTSASPGNVPTTTIVDTLGVTHCGGTFAICGGDANASPFAGTDTSAGKPLGTPFPGTGFTLAAADTTRPAPGDVASYCYDNSWYAPCYGGTMMVVLTYTKTAWPAGIGGLDGLAPVSDPGASAGDTARVNLLFRERAYWLYLTGHRQGDLRRLIRQYGRAQEHVYPTGNYLAPGAGTYGSAVTVPIPSSEAPNPYFHGCLDRNA